MRRALAMLATALALAPADGLAHHSFAMFDYSKVVTLKGTVKELQWTNPHVILWVVGSPTAGAPAETWSAELTSPGNLTRMGWTRHDLNPGDRVEVELSPLRDGAHGGAFRKATLTDSGKVLTAAGRDTDRPGLQ